MIWAPGSFWNVFKVVQAGFEKFRAGSVSWGALTAPQAVRSQRGGMTAQAGSLTALGRVSRFLLFVVFPCCIAALVQGECALGQGELSCVQGELFVLFELWIGGLCSLLEHAFVSNVSSRCPCLRGPRLVLLQVILLFAFSLAFDRLLELSFSHFFSFPFLFSYPNVCVVNALIKREIEDLCGSRTSRWMLPAVMSD
jgi:hypothetical protein